MYYVIAAISGNDPDTASFPEEYILGPWVIQDMTG
jgi:hypothetical protein